LLTVAPEDLEVEAGEDDIKLEAGLVMLADEAGNLSQRTKSDGGKIHTAEILF
jgi:hypothetical protein